VTWGRVFLAVVAAVSLGSCGSPGPTGPTPDPTPPPRANPIITAAGDISCAPGTQAACRQMQTADVIGHIAPNLVLALGDNQYDNGEMENYLASYQPSWGRFKSFTRPAPGNHEYQSPGARGYFDYFNGLGRPTGVAGERTKGYYSYDLGAWHFVVLNSNCRDVGCEAGSEQDIWLRQDLASSDSHCTLAYFHHPLFASGPNGNQPQMRALWQDLYDANVDVVLSGHDHIYERFTPQTPQGVADSSRGIREFVVGTGGHDLTRIVSVQRNSEVRSNQAFGVLKMELRGDGYDWEFRPIVGSDFTDEGTGTCH
jgi:acid phosphatase type 7